MSTSPDPPARPPRAALPAGDRPAEADNLPAVRSPGPVGQRPASPAPYGGGASPMPGQDASGYAPAGHDGSSSWFGPGSQGAGPSPGPGPRDPGAGGSGWPGYGQSSWQQGSGYSQQGYGNSAPGAPGYNDPAYQRDGYGPGGYGQGDYGQGNYGQGGYGGPGYGGSGYGPQAYEGYGSSGPATPGGNGAPGYGASGPGYGTPAPRYGASGPGYGSSGPGYAASGPGYGSSGPGYPTGGAHSARAGGFSPPPASPAPPAAAPPVSSPPPPVSPPGGFGAEAPAPPTRAEQRPAFAEQPPAFTEQRPAFTPAGGPRHAAPPQDEPQLYDAARHEEALYRRMRGNGANSGSHRQPDPAYSGAAGAAAGGTFADPGYGEPAAPGQPAYDDTPQPTQTFGGGQYGGAQFGGDPAYDGPGFDGPGFGPPPQAAERQRGGTGRKLPGSRKEWTKVIVGGVVVIAVGAGIGAVVAPRVSGAGSDPGCKAYQGTALPAYDRTVGDLNAKARQPVLTSDLTTTINDLTSAQGSARSSQVKTALGGLHDELTTVRTDVRKGYIPSSAVTALNGASQSADNAC